MRLVSFLGTGRYKPITYTSPKGDAICTSQHVQEALIAHYNITEVKVLVTPEARDAHDAGLRQALEPHEVSLSYQEIGGPVDEAGQWKLFNALAQAVAGSDRAMLDITHSFRSVPLIGIAAALYLEKLHDLTVDPIVYGHFDQGTGTARVVELSSFLSLIKLSNSADIFERTGDARPLQRQLKQASAYDASPVLDNLGHMSDALHLHQGPALSEAAQNLHTALSSYDPTTHRRRAERAILRRVDDAFTPFRQTDSLRVQLAQVRYYTDRRSWSAALIAVVELIITVVCMARGRPADRPDSRADTRELLNEYRSPARRAIDADLRKHYGKLKSYRNRVSHNAQGRSVKGDVQALSRQIETALKAFLKDAPTLLKDYL